MSQPRSTPGSTPGRTRGLTAVLASIAVLLPACSDDPASSGSASPDGGSPESAGTDPSTSSATAPPSASPDDSVEATRLVDLAGDSALEPGRYAMEVSSEESDALAVLIDVPAGYQGGGDGYEIAATEDDDSGFRHFSTWTVDEVARQPCNDDTTWADPGPSVDDLAGALAALPVWDSTRPVPRTIGGHEGVYLELNVPADLSAACREGEPHSWHDHLGYTQGISSGKDQHLWIVDVDGERVMLLAGYFPGTEGPTPRQVQELTRMAESATFVAADQVAAD